MLFRSLTVPIGPISIHALRFSETVMKCHRRNENFLNPVSKEFMTRRPFQYSLSAERRQEVIGNFYQIGARFVTVQAGLRTGCYDRMITWAGKNPINPGGFHGFLLVAVNACKQYQDSRNNSGGTERLLGLFFTCSFSGTI